MTLAPDAAAADGFRAPLFAELCERLGRSERRLLLELGALSAGTLELLHGYRCCLQVLVAAEALAALSGGGHSAEELDRQVADLLAPTLAEPVDAVFCWDLLDYLDPPLLAAFGRRLAAIVRPGGVAHALIHTTAAALPTRPSVYAALAADRLQCLGGDADGRQPPRYSPWDIEKHSANLRVERSVMLRNGMQEFLLRVEPQAAAPREIPALYRVRE